MGNLTLGRRRKTRTDLNWSDSPGLCSRSPSEGVVLLLPLNECPAASVPFVEVLLSVTVEVVGVLLSTAFVVSFPLRTNVWVASEDFLVVAAPLTLESFELDDLSPTEDVFPTFCCLLLYEFFLGLLAELFAFSDDSFFDDGFSALVCCFTSGFTQFTVTDCVTSLVVLVFNSIFCVFTESALSLIEGMIFFLVILAGSSLFFLEFLSGKVLFFNSVSFPALWLRARPFWWGQREFCGVDTSPVLLRGLLGFACPLSRVDLLLLGQILSLFLSSSAICLFFRASCARRYSFSSVFISWWLFSVSSSSEHGSRVVSTTSPTLSSWSWSKSSAISCGLFSSGKSSPTCTPHNVSLSLAAFFLFLLSLRFAAAFFFLMSSFSFSCSSSLKKKYKTPSINIGLQLKISAQDLQMVDIRALYRYVGLFELRKNTSK